MKSELFSKTAVESLSTPEQLDIQVKIIRPSSWILFAAILIAAASAVIWAFLGTISNGVDYAGVIFGDKNVISLYAEMGGVVQDVLADEGEQVKEGDILAVISEDVHLEEIELLIKEQENYDEEEEEWKRLEKEIERKMGRALIRSTADGVVQRVVLQGTAVEAGDVVAAVVPEDIYSYQEVMIYVPKEEVGALAVGMKAQITPTYVTREEYGYMEGVVAEISENLVTENSILRKMGTMDYVEDILPNTNCVVVSIQLSVDSTSQNSYVWSNEKGGTLDIRSGDKCQVHILKKEYRPYKLLLN